MFRIIPFRRHISIDNGISLSTFHSPLTLMLKTHFPNPALADGVQKATK